MVIMVYVLDNAKIPSLRSIKIIKTIKNSCMIESGLKKGERIVVDGVAKVLPGKPVKIAEKKSQQENKTAADGKSGGDNPMN